MIIFTAYNQKTRGGAYVLWRRLVIELAASPGNTVFYAATERIPEADAEFVKLGASDRKSRFASISFLVRLFLTALFRWKAVSPDTFAISQGNLYSIALLPLTWRGAKMITLIHGNYELEYDLNSHPSWFKRPIQCLIGFGYRRSYHILPVSQDLKLRTMQRYGIPSERFRVVPNSVPDITPLSARDREALRSSWGVESHETLILYVGALSQIKRVDVLLRAMAAIPPKCRPQLRIVGDGPLQEQLETLSLSLGLSNYVEFLGVIPDIRLQLIAADLLISCSDYEGCPTVLMEALANGVLVIATRVGGVPEIVGTEDLLVPPGSPDRLAEAMEKLLTLSQSERMELLGSWLERANTFRQPWENGVIDALQSESIQRGQSVER